MIQYTAGWMVWHFRMASCAEMLPASETPRTLYQNGRGNTEAQCPSLADISFLNSPYKKQGRRHRTFVVYGRVVRMAEVAGDPAHPRSIRCTEVRSQKGRTMWDKRDWQQFFEISQRRWQRRRPPRPVVPSGTNRLLPTAGFSLSELDDAGINLEIAERLGLPIDAVRIGAYGPNVSALRDFARSARQPT